MSITLTTGGAPLEFWQAKTTPDGLEVHAFAPAKGDVTVHAPGGSRVRHPVIVSLPLVVSKQGRPVWLVSCGPGERVAA